MKNVAIFSPHLCGYLQMRGFVLCGMRSNDDGSGKFVYYFKKSEEIYHAMSDHKKLYGKDENE